MSNLLATWLREPFIGGCIETNQGTGRGKIVFDSGVSWLFEDRSELNVFHGGWYLRKGNKVWSLDCNGRATGVREDTQPYTGPVTLSAGKSENGCGGQPGVPVIRCWGCRADYANEAERCADRRVAESIAEDETPPIGGIVDVTHA